MVWQVIDNDPIDEANYLFKVRCELTSGQVLEIRLHAVGGSLRYSYQEFSERPCGAGITRHISRICRTSRTINTTSKEA